MESQNQEFDSPNPQNPKERRIRDSGFQGLDKYPV